jgi:hypothetical protein
MGISMDMFKRDGRACSACVSRTALQKSDEFKLALARQPQRVAPSRRDLWRTPGVSEGRKNPDLTRAVANLTRAD